MRTFAPKPKATQQNQPSLTPNRDGAARNTAPSPSSGAPLPPDARATMESHFGYDLRRVRIHTDSQAAADMGAKAFVSGRDIFFSPRRSPSDRRLLAHELTHVVQQATGDVRGLRGAGGDESRREELERRAEHESGRLGVVRPSREPRTLLPLPSSGSPVLQFDFEEDVLRELHRLPSAEEEGLPPAERRRRWDVNVRRNARLRRLFRGLVGDEARRYFERLSAPRREDDLSVRFHTMLDTAFREELLGYLRSGQSWQARVDDALGPHPGRIMALINEALARERDRYPELVFPVRTYDELHVRKDCIYYRPTVPEQDSESTTSGETLIGYRPNGSDQPLTSWDHPERTVVSRADRDGRVGDLFVFIILTSASLSRGSPAYTRATLYHEYQHYRENSRRIADGSIVSAPGSGSPPSSHVLIWTDTLIEYFTQLEGSGGRAEGRGTEPYPRSDEPSERFEQLRGIEQYFDGASPEAQEEVLRRLGRFAASDPEVRSELLALSGHLSPETTFRSRLRRVLLDSGASAPAPP